MRDTLLSARDFLAERNIELAPGGRHRAPTRRERRAAARLATASDDDFAVLVVDVLALIVDLDALGADVRTVDREPNGDCTSCQVVGQVADVAIYDANAYDEVCRECAPAAVKAATTDAVVVEVCIG